MTLYVFTSIRNTANSAWYLERCSRHTLLHLHSVDSCQFISVFYVITLPSVLRQCRLSIKIGAEPVKILTPTSVLLTLLVGCQNKHPACKKIEWWGAGVVICLEQGADELQMVQLMPLPPIISCFTKIQIGLTFLVSAYPGWPGKATTTTTVLRPFVRDYPGELVPEETLTHPPSWSSSNLYQLLLSTMIHSILPVQITCLAIFLHNLRPCPLWSTSWSGALHLYSIHFFTQSVSSFRSTCPYHCNLFCCSINIISSIPSLSLNSFLEVCLLH